MTDVLQKQAPLEDLMAAMDVVDTLRHQRDIAERELDSEGRRERFLQRLKELYQAQGIEVPEHVLKEGIDALEQERFAYQPVASSWRTKLANLWVSRSRWGKPVGFLAVVGSMFSGVYLVTDVLPERQLRSGLPKQLSESVANIKTLAKNPQIVNQVETQLRQAEEALEDDKLSEAQTIEENLNKLEQLLQDHYSIRIVSRPNQSSGVWRVPDINTAGRNYYLIVEAINSSNKIVTMEILNEETNKRNTVKSWGIRVDEDTFYKVAADKNDDGIIQANEVGEKPIGYAKPVFSIATTGGMITKW